LYQSGLLDFFTVQILGKSTDLTGRTFFWQVVMTAFNNSNLTLLGGGYSAGVSGYFMDNSVDNGYIEKILEFGYFGSPFIFGLYIVILWWCMTLVVRARRDQAMLNVFPIGIVATIAIANITESNFMTKSFGTILLSIAVAVIVHQRSRQPVRASAPDPRPFGTARPGPGRERGMPGHSVGR
jgi:O-antigen ligase